ncbi:hypothetical protein JMG10_45615 [Nostoc ellipsosporum NOK]|nr:hypothetical protein [Nostoc ellipsosporum NOK]
MNRLRPLAAALSIAIALAVVLRRSGYSTYGVLDTGIFVVFLIFFWWLISDFSSGKGRSGADGIASAEKSIAFRFGRFLSGMFRRG